MRALRDQSIKDRDPNSKLIQAKRGRGAKRKGAAGEREFAKFLTKRGFEARRGRQFSGSDDSPDVVCEDLDYLHFEVKRVEKLNIYTAIKQAMRDCGINKIPCVAHRRNADNWLLTMNMFDFLNLVQCIMGREDELNSAWEKLNVRGFIGERARNSVNGGSGQAPKGSTEEVTSDSDLL